MMRHADPAKSRAVLIGVVNYADPQRWPSLPAVRANVNDLKRVLTDPDLWGLRRSHCVILLDPRDRGRVLEAIHTAAEEATDTVLIYYGGHGATTDSDLLLTLSSTTTRNLHYKSVEYRAVRGLLQERRAAHAVVVLDSCFSGRAHAMADVASFIDSQISMTSAYTLTSCARDSVSLAPKGASHTAFTGQLLRVFETGIPEAYDYLTLADITRAVTAGLVESRMPAPRFSQSGTGDLLALIRNRRWPPESVSATAARRGTAPRRPAPVTGAAAAATTPPTTPQKSRRTATTGQTSGQSARAEPTPRPARGRLPPSTAASKTEPVAQAAARVTRRKIAPRSGETSAQPAAKTGQRPGGIGKKATTGAAQPAAAQPQKRAAPIKPNDRLLPSQTQSGIQVAHDDWVLSVAFSPDGTRLATGSRDSTARLWDLTTGRELVRFTHNNTVMRVAFSPDGAQLATACLDRSARLWQPATGGELARFTHQGGVNGVAFSPNAARLASASDDSTARLWDLDSGRELARFIHEKGVDGVAFSPDGARLATGSKDETARLWDLASRRELARFADVRYITHRISMVAFSPDGTRLVTLGGDAVLWDLDSGREIARFTHDRPGSSVSMWSVSFSPDGSRLATAGGRLARVWDIGTCDVVARVKHSYDIADVAFSPDGRRIATASRDGTARVWNL
jgi:WD40 repeat protein